MVFPAGVGPGSSSKYVVNWLSSLLSWSVKTRRWYGWLMIVFPGARLFRAPIWCPSGGGSTRKAGSIIAESLVALYPVSTHQIPRGWREARSSTSQESGELLCARIKGANREVSDRKKLISGHALFSLYEGRKGAANGQHSSVFFRDAQGFRRLDAGSRAGFTSSGPH